jgi:multisubunit Na+/H+ antiporter MnhB subunit
MTSIIFASWARMLAIAMLLVSLFILLRGHNEPGGGFIGGLIAAGALATVAFAYGTREASRYLVFHPCAVAGAGLLLALLSGLPGLIGPENAFLHHLWITLPLGGIDLKLGTTIPFDIGVYLVVVGSIAAFIFALMSE